MKWLLFFSLFVGGCFAELTPKQLDILKTRCESLCGDNQVETITLEDADVDRTVDRFWCKCKNGLGSHQQNLTKTK